MGRFEMQPVLLRRLADRKGYQMDPHNLQEAIREAELDVQEGADILMVKPGMAYLDVLYAVKRTVSISNCDLQRQWRICNDKSRLDMAGYVDEAALVCESAVVVFVRGQIC